MILKRQFFLKYQITPTIYQVITAIEGKEFQFLKCKYVFKTPKQVTDVATGFQEPLFWPAIHVSDTKKKKKISTQYGSTLRRLFFFLNKSCC